MQKLGANTIVSVVMLVVCQQVNTWMTGARDHMGWGVGGRARRGGRVGRVVAGGWLVFLRLRHGGCWCRVDLAEEFQYRRSPESLCVRRTRVSSAVRESQRLGSHADTAGPAS